MGDRMGEFVQFSVNGLMTGALYALIAAGIVAVYKSTRVVNFAHGHIIMLGAYLFYTFVVLMPRASWVPDWYRNWKPEWLAELAAAAQPFSMDSAIVSWVGATPRIAVALIAAVVLNAIIGIAIERLFLRPLAGHSTFSMIMVTIGLISVLDGVVSMLWAADADYVPYQGPHGAIWFEAFGTQIFVFGSSLTNFAIAVVLFAAILTFFYLTPAGVAFRATAEDPAAASSMGINVPRVFSATWALACATGAMVEAADRVYALADGSASILASDNVSAALK